MGKVMEDVLQRKQKNDSDHENKHGRCFYIDLKEQFCYSHIGICEWSIHLLLVWSMAKFTSRLGTKAFGSSDGKVPCGQEKMNCLL